jgi:hypothetical protein
MNRDKMNRRQNTTQKTRGVGVEAMGHLYFPLKSGGDKRLFYYLASLFTLMTRGEFVWSGNGFVLFILSYCTSSCF